MSSHASAAPTNPAINGHATFSEDASPPAGESHHPTDSKGWDGKLRAGDPRATLPEVASDGELPHSDDDAPQVDQIAADEGKRFCGNSLSLSLLTIYLTLPEVNRSAGRLSLRHRGGISPMAILARQELTDDVPTGIIEDPTGLSSLAPTLEDLDLYDNLISHIKGLEELTKLTSLDLSFNKIKHIKRVNHLTELLNIYFVQNKIARIENLGGLVNLRNLELAANRLRADGLTLCLVAKEIENLDTLTSLEELWLGKNKITELKNISHLQNLKILSIQSNRLTRLEGLDSLSNLQEVYVSHNAITEISGLDHNTNLHVLDISNNQISNLVNIAHLKSLEELWASNNKLSSFEEVERELKDKENLNTVYFEGNPMQLSNMVTYRNKLRLALPQVMQIDASELLCLVFSLALGSWRLIFRAKQHS
ncbi:hypothetical protein FGG08_002956 [Glutinoglossum americanum]|uniref:Protein phosphatase 1 regulatory subunit 7 n=1 Tax=Glutinoglossum americanum TaxID=1670608 RepID=A0A9P8L419_9PEZI|nr:hypothetical protein FGG08_002956 [Glutinoglossum americanum]